MKTVADLINDLFATYKRPDGREYTHKEVSVALGGVIDPSYLSKLRSNKIPNPGRDTLLALCRFFKVQPSYFFPELEQADQHEGKPETLPADQLHVALRSIGLQTDIQEQIERLIRVLQQGEK